MSRTGPPLDQPAEARLTVLSGPSGVGKDAVVAAVRDRHPDLGMPVAHRGHDGVQYHFVNRAEFARLVEANLLLEHAEYAGNLYGTPRLPVVEQLAEGRPALLVIELQGMRQVRKVMPDAQFVFLAPPYWEELVRRLVGRGTEPEDVQRQRLDQARIELAAEAEFDVTIVNDSVEHAADELVRLIEQPVPRNRG